MDFVNAIVRNSYLAPHGAVTGAASVPGIACDFHRALYSGGDGVSGFDRAVEVRADLGFKLFRPKSAVRVREFGDEAGSVRGDEAEHGMVVLILHDAHDEVDFLVREVSADRVDEGFDAVRVVGAIDDEKRFPRENLEAARPGSLGETGTDGVLRDAQAAADQAVDDVEHSHRVFHLVVSEQLDPEMLASAVVEDLPVDRPRPGGESRRIRGDEASSCVWVHVCEALLHDVHDVRELVVEDAVGTGFQDTCFLGGDLLDGVSEEFGVIKADVHDRADLRMGDDVRRIEAATHADLEDDEIAVLLLEVAEGHRSDHFEVRRLLAEGLRSCTHTGSKPAEIRIRNRLAIDRDALVKLVEVRRDIETGTETRRRQNRLGHDAGRALAVRAGDVHIAELLLWVTKRVHEIPHPFESDLRMFPVRPVKERDGFIPVHVVFFLHLCFSSCHSIA